MGLDPENIFSGKRFRSPEDAPDLPDPVTVALLWDHSREEHGEGPSLVDVYESREAAERAIQSFSEGERETLEIDEREAKR